MPLRNTFLLGRRIGIDLGTTRTRIWSDQEGMSVDEPTCLAFDHNLRKVVAVGQDAAEMEGRTPAHIEIYWPIQAGLIDNIEMCQLFLQLLLQRVIPHAYFFRPTVMVSVPANAMAIDHDVVTQVMEKIGAREVYTIPQPLVAAIGADIPIADASGTFLLHLGGGVVEAAVISFGSMVAHCEITRAGRVADQKIRDLLKKTHALSIGIPTAEQLKKKIGSVTVRQGDELVAGSDVITSAPKEVTIPANQLVVPLENLAQEYVVLIKQLLEKIPPELTADIIEKGMLLTGGFAQLNGLDSMLVRELGISVSVVENPEQVVIKGVANALENLELFKESLGYRG